MDTVAAGPRSQLRTTLAVLHRRLSELEQQLAAQRQALERAEVAFMQTCLELIERIRALEDALVQSEHERDYWKALAKAPDARQS